MSQDNATNQNTNVAFDPNKTVVVATGNTHKLVEIEAILSKVMPGISFVALGQLGDFPDPEENGKTFRDNALIKAMAALDEVDCVAAIADDSGLCVDALNGEPGIFSARYAGEDGNDEKNNEKLLKENKKELEVKIENVISEREERRKEIQSDYEQIQIITGKLGLLSMKNESEFKKMIYVFTRESGLKMNEISKSETLWERNGYKLKYIHFTLYGSLNNFGKFLYFLNKSRKFIDTSRMYIDLTGEGFKISLGFIEKGKIVVKN